MLFLTGNRNRGFVDRQLDAIGSLDRRFRRRPVARVPRPEDDDPADGAAIHRRRAHGHLRRRGWHNLRRKKYHWILHWVRYN
jgi:hypothetical protein